MFDCRVTRVEEPILLDLVMEFDLSDSQTMNDVAKEAMESIWELYQARKAKKFDFPIPFQFVMLDPDTGDLHRITTCGGMALK